MAREDGAEAEKGNLKPTPEQAREMVVKSIREAKDSGEANQILKDFQEELDRKKLEAVNAVSRSVQHNLGTGLQLAMGSADLLGDHPDATPEIKELAENVIEGIREAYKAMQKYSKPLLQLQLVESGGFEIIDLEESTKPPAPKGDVT